MFIGAYLCTGLIFLAGGAFVLSRWGSRARASNDAVVGWRRYLVLSFASMLTALVLFIALSLALDILTIGQSGSWNYPQDYMAAGPVAWVAMLLPIIGILAPLLIVLAARTTRAEGNEGVHVP